MIGLEERPAQTPQGLSEHDLVALARQGEAQAVVLLVQRYSPMLRRVVSRFGAGVTHRDDLEQEGVLGLLSAVRSYDPGQSEAAFSTYAYACMRNRVVSAARRIRVRENREKIPENPEETAAAEAEDPAFLVQQREESDRLMALAARELSDLEFRVLQLYLHPFSYEEIAAHLSVSEKTVDNALQRVRRKLQKRLGKDSS